MNYCTCRNNNVRIETSNSEKNRGRQYEKCNECGKFKRWCSSSSSSSSSNSNGAYFTPQAYNNGFNTQTPAPAPAPMYTQPQPPQPDVTFIMKNNFEALAHEVSFIKDQLRQILEIVKTLDIKTNAIDYDDMK